MKQKFPGEKIWNTIKSFKSGNNDIIGILPKTDIANNNLQNFISNSQLFELYTPSNLMDIKLFSLDELRFMLKKKRDTIPELA